MKLIGSIILAIAVLIIISKYFLKAYTANDYNSQGLLYLNESNYNKALIEFERANEMENENWQEKVIYLRNISLAYSGLNEYELVLQTQKKVLQLCPENTYDYFVAKGDMDLIAEKTKSAITNFKAAIKINSDKLEANNSLGLIYVGDYGIEYTNLEEALVYNQKALQLYPYSITKNVLGRNYFLLENYKAADKYFTEIHKEYPKDIETKYSLGVTRYFLGDQKSAKKLLSQVYECNPEYFDDEIEILKKLNIVIT